MSLFYEFHQNNHPETVILLHSGGMAGVEWKPQIAPLSKYFNVLVPDLLGHGQSLIPEGKTLSISLIAESVIDLMKEKSIEKAHIVGSSMGGAVALWIALNVPQFVDKLVIYRIGYKKDVATHEQTTQMADPNYWRQYGLHSWLSKLHQAQGGIDAWERVIDNVSHVLAPNTSDHSHELADLQRIEAPTLLIAGDNDPLIPLPTLLDMYDAIPNAALWVMPNATHITATNTWRASAFSEEITRFLR